MATKPTQDLSAPCISLLFDLEVFIFGAKASPAPLGGFYELDRYHEIWN